MKILCLLNIHKYIPGWWGSNNTFGFLCQRCNKIKIINER